MRFPGYSVGAPLELADRVATDGPVVTDALLAFERIRAKGDDLALWDGGLFPQLRYTRVNIGKKNRARNHFQGIQRLRDGLHCVISGGDVIEPASHVFIARLPSCRNLGPWGSNLLLSREPSLGDSVVRTIAFDRGLWHSGGISLLGNALAIPLEGDVGSRIVFVDVTDPERPRRIAIDIERPGRKAGAVALARIMDGRFLCAVWWEVQAKPRGRIDFYLSKDDDLFHGFVAQPIEWSWAAVAVESGQPGNQPGDRGDPAYQCINFVAEPGGGLYLVGTENNSSKAPLDRDNDRADLLRVELPASSGESSAPPPRLVRIATRQLKCRDEFGNFDAAAGVYVTPDGQLHLYSAYHWRMKDLIRLSEFSAEPEPSGAAQSIDAAWIELFEHDDFGGRRLTIRGLRHSRLENYAAIFVEGSEFNDEVSSVRYRIPSGHTYRLFRDSDFRGTVPGRDFIDLDGTGQVVEVRDLEKERRFGDQVSSSCFV